MKLTRQRKRDVTWELVIPLSRQAVAVAAIGTMPSENYLFTGIGSWLKPISDSTLSKLYRDAGFAGQHVPHGWRPSFSTIMNELAAVEEREQDRAIIDLMLAHVQAGVEPSTTARPICRAGARSRRPGQICSCGTQSSRTCYCRRTGHRERSPAWLGMGGRRLPEPAWRRSYDVNDSRAQLSRSTGR